MSRLDIYNAIEDERTRQHAKWDGVFLDSEWSPEDWKAMIDDYSAWARRMACQQSLDKARNRYIQIAALAVAAVEQIDAGTYYALGFKHE